MKKTILLLSTAMPRLLAAIAIFACAIAQSTAQAQVSYQPKAQSLAGNPLYSHLAPSADHIYSLRLPQIIAKGELMNILNAMPPPKDSNQARLLSIIKDPASAGLNIDEILIAQTAASRTGADTINYTQILIRVTDSAKFRAAIVPAAKKMHLQIHRAPGGVMTTKDEKMGIAWNNRLLVANVSSAKTGETALQKSIAALTANPNNPLLTDQRFLSGFSSNEDVHAWSTKMDFGKALSKMFKKMAAKNPAMKGKPFPDYDNTPGIPRPPVLSTFNFADGRIIFKSTTFRQPDDAAVFRRLADRPVDKDLLSNVPAGTLLGAALMHINMAALPDLLDKYHARQKIDSLLGQKGLTITDITSALGGDFMLAALGDTTNATDTTKKRVNILFVATLGDPAKLMQLAAKASANTGTEPDTAHMAMMKKLMDKMVIRDNKLVISKSKEMAQSYFTTQDHRSTALFDDSKGMQTAVIDLKACSAFILATMSDNPKAMLAARIAEKLDKIQIDNGFLEGDNTVVTVQIITGDPSTNSLKTLVGLLH